MPWGSDRDGWPYRLFSFQASAAGTPPEPAPVEAETLDPGYHVEAGGALQLTVGLCAVAALLGYQRFRERTRPPRPRR